MPHSHIDTDRGPFDPQPTHGDILHELKLMRSDVRENRTEAQAWRESNDRELESIRKELATNTVITTEIKNIYTTGVTITRFVRWIGYFGAGVAGIAAAWWALMKDNPPPPTIWPPQ